MKAIVGNAICTICQKTGGTLSDQRERKVKNQKG